MGIEEGENGRYFFVLDCGCNFCIKETGEKKDELQNDKKLVDGEALTREKLILYFANLFKENKKTDISFINHCLEDCFFIMKSCLDEAKKLSEVEKENKKVNLKRCIETICYDGQIKKQKLIDDYFLPKKL